MHGRTSPYLNAPLKQRSLLYRSFHNACAQAEIAREQVLSRCLLRLLREILHQNCTGVLVRIFQPNLSPIPPQLREDFRSLKQLSSHKKCKLRGFKKLTQISLSLSLSLSISVPLSYCNVSVPISHHLSSTKSEYYKNVAI
jgi:hypothetical protein